MTTSRNRVGGFDPTLERLFGLRRISRSDAIAQLRTFEFTVDDAYLWANAWAARDQFNGNYDYLLETALKWAGSDWSTRVGLGWYRLGFDYDLAAKFWANGWSLGHIVELFTHLDTHDDLDAWAMFDTPGLAIRYAEEGLNPWDLAFYVAEGNTIADAATEVRTALAKTA